MHENILIVEDNALDRKILSNLLEKKNYIPIESQDAFEALEKIEENTIDLILLDIKLPRCNGFELLKRLGNYCTRKNVPIIMMSANRLDKAGVLQSFKYGASDFVVKPIQAEALYSKIEKLKSANKINKKVKAKLPDNTLSELTTKNEIIYLEEHGITIETSSPYTKDQHVIFNSDFFVKYGIEDLLVTAKDPEKVNGAHHQFLSFEKSDRQKLEKIRTIYNELSNQTEKQQEENFRSAQ